MSRRQLQLHSHSVVAWAVHAGRLPRPELLRCADCGVQARVYDHRDYRKPLTVVALCVSCNARRPPALPLHKAKCDRTVVVSRADRQLAAYRKNEAARKRVTAALSRPWAQIRTIGQRLQQKAARAKAQRLCPDHLRRLREGLGLSMEEFAARMGKAVSWRSIERWEQGTFRPRVEQLELIADAFDIDIGILFGPRGRTKSA